MSTKITFYQPPKYRLYVDETLVQVISPTGQRCGEFPWPTSSLWLLALCNGSLSGGYFAWKQGSHDVDGTLMSPKLSGIDTLKPKN